MSGDTLARSDTLVNAKWQGKQGYFFSEKEGSDRCLRSRVRGSRHHVCGPRGNPSLCANDKKWTCLNSASTPKNPFPPSFLFPSFILSLEEAWPTIAAINNGDARPQRAWGAPDQESNENFAPPPCCV